MDWSTPGLVRNPVCLVSVDTITVTWLAGVMVSLTVSLVLPEQATGTLCSPLMEPDFVTFGELGGIMEGEGSE